MRGITFAMYIYIKKNPSPLLRTQCCALTTNHAGMCHAEALKKNAQKMCSLLENALWTNVLGPPCRGEGTFFYNVKLWLNANPPPPPGAWPGPETKVNLEGQH